MVFQKHYHYITVLRTTVTYLEKNVPKHSTVLRIHQGLHLVIVPLYKDMKKVSKRKIIFISTRVVMSCIQDMIIIFKNISLFEHYYGLSKSEMFQYLLDLQELICSAPLCCLRRTNTVLGHEGVQIQNSILNNFLTLSQKNWKGYYRL